MVRALFDTNIIIDYLNGNSAALREMSLYTERSISVITYAEVLIGVKDLGVLEDVKEFLLSFNLIDIDQEVSEIGVEIRKNYKLRLPDALILASAQKIGAVLVTRNTKDFNETLPFVRVPYKV